MFATPSLHTMACFSQIGVKSIAKCYCATSFEGQFSFFCFYFKGFFPVNGIYLLKTNTIYFFSNLPFDDVFGRSYNIGGTGSIGAGARKKYPGNRKTGKKEASHTIRFSKLIKRAGNQRHQGNLPGCRLKNDSWIVLRLHYFMTNLAVTLFTLATQMPLSIFKVVEASF